jgi:squalene-hopene/tetraprenyl-beta-curcumene cyclase
MKSFCLVASASTGVSLLMSLLWIAPARPADTRTAPTPRELQPILDKAIAFLRSHQNDDGSFAPRLGGPGISALVAAGLIRNDVSPDDPLVAKTLAYLEKKIHEDGGIYDKGLANYTTSVALLAFREANTGRKYDTVIKRGAEFLKKLQYDESLVEDRDPRFGGVGYDKHDSRPDLSNTQYFLEALLSAGVPKDDPAIQRALRFINRCQNLPGEFNDQPFAKKATAEDKGGLTYNPIFSDKNPARTPEGGLRSSGVMTYAGLKSFLHAGVSKDDPRVQAAVGWIRRHYTLDQNPGQGLAGLYYYYHTFGKAMTALGEDPFVDSAGMKHAWRNDLFTALKKRQRPDGSWSNSDRAFYENSPELATAYAVLTLSYCRQPK